MKILEIKINEFGCLSDKHFDLSEGFNLAMGDNESGKSTLLSFIKFIFYGLPKKNQDAHLERDRGFGWRSNTADGSLTLLADDGKSYAIERRALRRGEKRETVTEECRIIDLQSGSPVFEGEDPGKLFLKVDTAVFESTCFIRQMGVTVLNGDDVGAALENILLSADESIDLQSSLDRLDEVRKLLLHKKGSGGLIPHLEAEGEDLSHRLNKARIAYERILSATYTADKLKGEAMEKRNELNRLEDLFSAVSKAETVARFDALHKKEAELESAKRELSDLHENNKGKNGRFPSEELTERLYTSRAAYLAAKDEYSRAASAYKSALEEREAETGRSGAELPLSATEIRSLGGPEAICGKIKEETELARKKRGSARLFFVISALLIVSGGALLPFMLPHGIPLLLIPVGLLLLSALFAALGFSTRSSAKRSAAAASERLSSLGFDPSDDDSAERLKASLLLSLQRESELIRLDSKVSLAASSASLRKGDLDSAAAIALAALSEWKGGDRSSILSDIDSTITEIKELTARDLRLSLAVSAAEGQVNAMRSGLEGINEGDIRARVSPDAMAAYQNGQAEAVARSRRFCAEQLRSINDKIHEVEKELIRLENETEDPSRLAVLLEENRMALGRENQRLEAIKTAMTALSEAGEDLRSSLSPILRGKAEGYMSFVTDSKYSSLGIDTDYTLSAKTDFGVRPVSLLSAGTRDVAYLALRLALSEVIFGDIAPFVALDESLSQLDDKRAAAALRMLSAYCGRGGQCLLFTCHTREYELLKNITDANLIRL